MHKISEEVIGTQYKQLRPLLDRLREEVIFVLQSGLEKADIKVHAIHSRVKELNSITEKLARIEQGGGPPPALESIGDLVGLRVVCLFLSDIPRVGGYLREFFSVLREDNKIDGADVTSFGYQSVHFICELPDSYSGARYNQLKSMQFEIQVRTIAMDAWAAASHYLDYKSEQGVPLGLRKDFYALSGLFYVADTHFEMFYKEAQRSREVLRNADNSNGSFLSQLLNVDTFSEYLRENFSDRSTGTRDGASELLEELLECGFKTIGDLDAAIKRGMPAFLKFEKANPPDGSKTDPKSTKKYADIGVVRILLQIVDENYLNMRKKKHSSINSSYYEKFSSFRKHLL